MTDSARWAVRQAAHCINQGGIVAYPTEAVYGLGCDPLNEQAVMRLLGIKQRDPRQGLILIGCSIEDFDAYIQPVEPDVLKQLDQSWPGPVTWLLPASTKCPRWLTGEHDTIAIRATAHEMARELCRQSGMAIVSTSANRSGRPPARSAFQVRRELGSEIDFLLHGATGGRLRPSEIRDARTNQLIRG
ncbi:MAG: threonylcarbamoyl-AMP synthase [Gammaproteobacteria bacterium]|nr:MAG: threonylcarbamoyl-AMP synthase [Gammaproteobacteria bacterium]